MSVVCDKCKKKKSFFQWFSRKQIFLKIIEFIFEWGLKVSLKFENYIIFARISKSISFSPQKDSQIPRTNYGPVLSKISKVLKRTEK